MLSLPLHNDYEALRIEWGSHQWMGVCKKINHNSTNVEFASSISFHRRKRTFGVVQRSIIRQSDFTARLVFDSNENGVLLSTVGKAAL
jgi:hypothetical protein